MNVERLISSAPFKKDEITYALFETLMNAVNGNAKLLLLKQGSYDEVKRQLILRPLNFDNSQAGLTDVPHIRFGDIALVLYGVVTHNDNDYFTTKITRDYLERFEKTESEILRNALANTSRLYPPRLYSVQALVFGHKSDIDFMQNVDRHLFSTDCSSYILTSNIELNDAAVVFYPDVLKNLASFLGQSFYVAFTSIHEAQIHIMENSLEDAIRDALQDTNKHCNSPTETLSDKVHFYSKGRNAFGVLENGEFKKLW